jgi:hypothetical protein
MEYWQGHDSSHQVNGDYSGSLMKSLVEAVTNIVLFILTPVIMVWVQISLAQVIEKLGELPIEESETWAVYRWAGNSEEAVLDTEPFIYRQTAAERSHFQTDINTRF